jgi:RNA polymerase sigma-70 factor, ECF subfamily
MSQINRRTGRTVGLKTAARKESPVSAYAIANSNPEQNLITQARNGDVNAFATLYETYKPRIVAVCLRMTKDMAEAEDLTQDAFIYVFRKFSTFRGDSAFSTWLHRVAVNTVLMHFRRKGRRQMHLEHPNPPDSGRLRREYGRVDERLARCADRLALTRAINELPPGYRTIFLLHEMQGYEHQEIARRLHCSIGNSKSQLHKAKLRMRELLSPRGYIYRQRVATAKPTAFRARVSAEPATIGSLVLSSTDASPCPTNQMSVSDTRECKNSLPGRLGGVASSADKKQRSRRKDLTDQLIGSHLGIMLPAIAQANPAPIVESAA